MRFLPRWSRELALAAVLLGAASPGEAWAKPDPNYKPKGGFRLMASALNIFKGNKVQCALLSSGQVCAPVSSTIGGGYWPAGTNNQYIFNTGLQIAGVFDPASTLPWAGTTDGAFFFNARGGGNGQAVTQVFNSADPADLAGWPDAAIVPADPLYDPALQGRKAASDNDAWFLSWEGDPAQNAGRTHPLGVLVETRGLAYNAPGKTDFLFFIFTIYNVTAGDPAVYAAYAARPAIQSILIQYGAKFQALNEAKFGAGTIPDAGYAIKDAFVAFGADMDVTFENSGNDYDGVNVPFSMGYTYEAGFTAPGSWTFDPAIYKPPFFPGSGFVGVKYLKSPVDPNTNLELGLTLFGATSNGGEFSDPVDSKALYRYLSGHLDPNQQDDQCNVGDVEITKICYINQATPNDMRFFQASGPLDLGPGESQTIAVAYVLAAPVKSGACTGPDVCNEVRPQAPTGDLTRLTNIAVLAGGANTVDTITGFNGFLGDLNANGKVDESEIKTIPGSLLGKADVAQGVFNAHFVQPSPPLAPPFYLLPGDGQVTVVWQPSATDAASPGSTGDPYYASSKSPANAFALYDPNYRQFDVEGYRVYRGRTGDAGSLTLLAQFDYSGTTMLDSLGIVNQIDANNFTNCAPQLDTPVLVSCVAAGTTGPFNLVDGLTVPLNGNFIQNQAVVASGTVGYVTKADSALTGGASGRPPLGDTGVPFVFVDKAGSCTACGVTNGQRYFYVVTAFDINSVISGAGSSLESSASLTRPVIPQHAPSNAFSTAAVALDVVGGGSVVDSVIKSVPTLNATTGVFSGPFPPADGGNLAFVGQFLPALFSQPDSILVTLNAVHLGDARNGVPVGFDFTATGTGVPATNFSLQIAQSTGGAATAASNPFPAAAPDPGLAGKFGIPATFRLSALADFSMQSYQVSGAQGRDCFVDAIFLTAADCIAWGPRWFSGPEETAADPNKGTIPPAAPTLDDLNNAGTLPGVKTIFHPEAYGNVDAGWRQAAAVLAGAVRAADFNLTWGAGGKITVFDVTHNVPVPFGATELGGNFAVLTQANSATAGSVDGQPGTLTLTDWGCVAELKTIPGTAAVMPCTGAGFPTTDVVTLGNVAFLTGGDYAAAAALPGVNQGFSIYIAGQLFLFEMSANTLPAPGTVWTLRSYTGYVTGGLGTPYVYNAPAPKIRPFSAVGASLRLKFNAANGISAATVADLKKVHTVPDPYYVTSAYENSVDNKIIKFVNLPSKAIIRIYSASGVLVRVLEHKNTVSSEEVWDVRNRGGQFVASGVYFWHVESSSARKVGRMTVVNFAK